MNIRAVLFDVYNTLLGLGPPPENADGLWEQLWRERFAGAPTLDLEAFSIASKRIIAREHAIAYVAGVAFPEIYWPAIAKEVLPELNQLEETALDEFLYIHSQLLRTVHFAPDAAEVLQALIAEGTPIGLVSNSQPYTIIELATSMEGTGLTLGSFQPDLCFLSYKHGFSKPDPLVFRLLAARLRARDILPAETMVVGDRPDNDIEPARKQDFQTWLLTPIRSTQNLAGNWQQLGEYLR